MRRRFAARDPAGSLGGETEKSSSRAAPPPLSSTCGWTIRRRQDSQRLLLVPVTCRDWSPGAPASVHFLKKTKNKSPSVFVRCCLGADEVYVGLRSVFMSFMLSFGVFFFYLFVENVINAHETSSGFRRKITFSCFSASFTSL